MGDLNNLPLEVATKLSIPASIPKDFLYQFYKCLLQMVEIRKKEEARSKKG
ncbi:hypothetical protein [Dapis sp. BLCC M126]|uniref:hypothetical protein n=1 Tax=Dapis sp. BLCC M126 TaxID=3400189 RepID=UPI003CF7DE40